MTLVEKILRSAGIPLVTAALWLAAAGCATPPPPQPESKPRNIQAEVMAEFERSVTSWNSGNLDGFMAIYAENATFAMKDHFVQGFDAIRRYYAPQFLPGAARGILAFEQLEVEILAPDIVLVQGIYQGRLGAETKRGTTTLVMRYVFNHWRIVHDQSS